MDVSELPPGTQVVSFVTTADAVVIKAADIAAEEKE